MSMPLNSKQVPILVAEDDPDDCHLIREAFVEAKLANELRFVENGVEVFDYLGRVGKFADPASSPWPGLLLLDLNMPRMDGREVLQRLKAEPKYCAIRVIVMTTSKAEEDILRSYQLAAASYITKPVTFQALVGIVRSLGQYWFEIVELLDHEAKRDS